MYLCFDKYINNIFFFYFNGLCSYKKFFVLYLLLLSDRPKRSKYKVVFLFILLSTLKRNKFYETKGHFNGCVFIGESSQDEEEEVKPVTVKFAHQESEEAKARRMASFDYLQKKQQEETWQQLEYNNINVCIVLSSLF